MQVVDIHSLLIFGSLHQITVGLYLQEPSTQKVTRAQSNIGTGFNIDIIRLSDIGQTCRFTSPNCEHATGNLGTV